LRLKAAYYRLAGVPENWDIEMPIRPNPFSPRKVAQNTIKHLLGLAHSGEAGHNLVGWSRLLIDTRSAHGLGAFDPAFERALGDQVRAVARQWREILRYRANRPYNGESADVISAARWIKARYRRLWS
jgi:hypothetical protein